MGWKHGYPGCVPKPPISQLHRHSAPGPRLLQMSRANTTGDGSLESAMNSGVCP